MYRPVFSVARLNVAFNAKQFRSFTTQKPSKPLSDAEQLQQAADKEAQRVRTEQTLREAKQTEGSGVQPPHRPSETIYGAEPYWTVFRNWVFSGFGFINNKYGEAHHKNRSRNQNVLVGIQWGIVVTAAIFAYYKYRRDSFEAHRKLMHSNADYRNHGQRVEPRVEKK